MRVRHRPGSRLWYLIQARHLCQAPSDYPSDRDERAGFPTGAGRPWEKGTFLSHGQGAEVPPAAIAKIADRWPRYGVANDPLSPSRATGCPVCPGYVGRLGTSMSAGLADCAAGACTRPFCPDCHGGTAVRTLITETSQPISCRISTKSENTYDYAAPRGRTPRQLAHGPYGHHAPLRPNGSGASGHEIPRRRPTTS